MKSRLLIGVVLFAGVLSLDSAAFAQADWTQRFPTSSPSRRFQTAMAQFGSNTLLFGGMTPSFPVGAPFDDTWLWDGANWRQLTSFGLFNTGPHPSARGRAAMAYDSDNAEVVMFGGDGGFGTTLGDTWIFSLQTNALLRRSFFSWGQPNLNQSPAARSFAVMEYDPVIKKIVLTGGIDDSGAQLNDTWTLDLNATNGPTWSRLFTSHSITPTRRATAMAKCGSSIIPTFGFPIQVSPVQLLLFGGSNDFGDSWMLNKITGSVMDWAGPFSPATEPEGRGDHNMAYYPVSNRVILYGGQNVHEAHLFSDTWNGLCGGSPTWAQATPAHNPGRREGMGMATGPDGLTVVLFGGLKENSFSELDENNETWTWGRRAACLPTDGSIIPRGSEVRCQFDKLPGVRFNGWSSDGFAPHEKKKLDLNFRTRKKGTATITADWTDADGAHSMTYTYTVTKRNDRDDDDDDD